jgi:hypothetical protein
LVQAVLSSTMVVAKGCAADVMVLITILQSSSSPHVVYTSCTDTAYLLHQHELPPYSDHRLWSHVALFVTASTAASTASTMPLRPRGLCVVYIDRGYVVHAGTTSRRHQVPVYLKVCKLHRQQLSWLDGHHKRCNPVHPLTMATPTKSKCTKVVFG